MPYRLMVASFLTAFFIAFLSMPYLMDLANKLNIQAQPGARKIHAKPIPTIGGLGIFLGVFVAVLLYTPAEREFLGFFSKETIGILLGSLVMVAVGFLDDWKDIRPSRKLMGQFLAFLVVWSFGIRIEYLSKPNGELFVLDVYFKNLGLPNLDIPGVGVITHLNILSMILTFLWTVGLSNMLNFIDGVDGLAGGVTSISALVLLLLNLGRPQALQGDLHYLNYMLAALIGGSLGFLRYNFHPAQIFMGDCGALFIGFMLACISIEGAMKGPTFIAFLTPVVVMGIPILDGTFSIFRRLVSRTKVSVADKKHIHHRLLERGLNQKQVALTLYGVSIGLGVLALVFSKMAPMVFYFFMVLTGLYTIYRLVKRVTHV